MARTRTVQLFQAKRGGAKLVGSLSEAIAAQREFIRTKVLRSAARAGALIFYREMRIRVPVDSGTLYGSIYHFHDEKRSTDEFQRYLIGPNMAKAPHWYNVEYGHWRYNAYADGRWLKSKSKKNARVATPGVMDKSVHDLPGALEAPVWTPAVPYIRPTYDAVAAEAIKAAQARIVERLREFQDNPDAE